MIFHPYIFLLLMQITTCNSKKFYDNEVDRIKNNEIALKDSVKNYKEDNNVLAGEKRGIILNLDELKEKYNNLLSNYNIKPSNKKTDIKYISRVEYKTNTIIKNVPLYAFAMIVKRISCFIIYKQYSKTILSLKNSGRICLFQTNQEDKRYRQ